MSENYRLRELQDLKNLFTSFEEFKNELLLKRDAAKRLFDGSHESRPQDIETAVLLVRFQVLDEVVQQLEKCIR